MFCSCHSFVSLCVTHLYHSVSLIFIIQCHSFVSLCATYSYHSVTFCFFVGPCISARTRSRRLFEAEPDHSTEYRYRSQLKAKFIDFLDENRLIFVVLGGRFQRSETDFSVLLTSTISHLIVSQKYDTKSAQRERHLLPLSQARGCGEKFAALFDIVCFVLCIISLFNDPISGVYYLIPLMSFSVLVGLAMDYDIFLMCRVSSDVCCNLIYHSLML